MVSKARSSPVSVKEKEDHIQIPGGKDQAASGGPEAVEWDIICLYSVPTLSLFSLVRCHQSIHRSKLQTDLSVRWWIETPYSQGMLQLWDCFTQHLFLQISDLSTSVWEFDVSTLNFSRLTSSFGCLPFFFFFFFFCTPGIWTFPAQGWNPSHSCDWCHSCRMLDP